VDPDILGKVHGLIPEEELRGVPDLLGPELRPPPLVVVNLAADIDVEGLPVPGDIVEPGNDP
jgi:hypothetical protein